MQTRKLEENISRMESMIERYESLANRQIRTEDELSSAKTEMRIMKESILSLIIETKKILSRVEHKTKL